MESIRFTRGVTLIELMVVLAIITILSGVIITSQASFNKSLLLSNTAYDVALSIRSAQTFGIGSRVTSGLTRNTGYGIHVASIPANSYMLFADRLPRNPTDCHPAPQSGSDGPDATPGDCMYTVGMNSVESDVPAHTYRLGNGITISDFCAYKGATANCNTRPSASSIAWLDIVFARPNTRTFISTSNGYAADNTSACIELTSPQGNFHSIIVGQSGEITTKAGQCPLLP